MKKILLFVFIVANVAAFSQEKNNTRKNPLKPKAHFQKIKKDPNIKHNGTSSKNKPMYHVDGNGFKEALHVRRKRSKRTGIR